jgi:hypothetical protein
MLSRETIAVYTPNHVKHINTPCVQSAELLTAKAGDANTYHWALKG